MKRPVLVIMAAGMGSRYGGLKQIDPIDREGHIIIDFSIYDARRAGFEKVVFIIKKDNEEECFRTAIWPEPFCFEKTPEENKTYAYFPYTEEGLDDVYDWLCTQYDEKKDRWDQAGESAMIFPKT